MSTFATVAERLVDAQTLPGTQGHHLGETSWNHVKPCERGRVVENGWDMLRHWGKKNGETNNMHF